jgi:serine/threonine-protein kinase
LAGRYELQKELGRGGMATVYLAQDLKHDRPVALKVLHPELAATLGPERFLREIKLAARLDHPHILALLDSGEADGLLWYSMPYVDGESLRDRLRREVQLPVEDARQLAREVADALDCAHEHGVVHRDIKPENILLAREHARVADFGVAHAVDAGSEGRLTETGLAIGTPAYMAPEQATGGRLDGRTDVYALGCVLYEMLAGQPPSTGPTAQAVIGQTLGAPVPSARHLRPDISRALDSVIRKALAKSAAARFATAREFARALEPSDHRRARVWTSLATAAALLLLIALGWALARPKAKADQTTSGPASRASVAVLPFQSLSTDSADAYFATGIAEDVSSQLARLGGITVVAHSSARAAALRAREPREIGLALGVATLLEGSVRRAGDQIRVTARLVDSRTGAQLWADDYDRTLRDVLGIQRDIAQQIAAALNATLTPGERAELGGRPHVDPEAYRLYLLGRHHFAKYTAPAMRRSIDYYEQALARDSTFAPAYAALADAQVFVVLWGRGRPRDLMPAARAAAFRAIALDSTLGDAHTALGLIEAAYEWNWKVAEARFRHAIALSPNSPYAHMWYGSFVLTPLGRHDEALAELRRAQELDPVSLPVRYNLGFRYYFARQFGNAIVEFQRALELDPGFAPARVGLGFTYSGLGRYDEAIRAMEEAEPDSAMTSNAVVGAVYAWAGRREHARTILLSVAERARRGYAHPMDFALLYAALGERDQAFQWLRRAYEERSFLLIWINVATWYDGIRDDSRFAALVRDVGLVPSGGP